MSITVNIRYSGKNGKAKAFAKYDLHMSVERFISDEGGIPKGDDRFIRK